MSWLMLGPELSDLLERNSPDPETRKTFHSQRTCLKATRLTVSWTGCSLLYRNTSRRRGHRMGVGYSFTLPSIV